MCRCWHGRIRGRGYGRVCRYRSVSWKGSGVIREQNVEGAFQLATLIDGSSARRYAVQEETYLAALETNISGINYQAAVCAVLGNCRGRFGLVSVINPGDQYRVGRSLRSSTYEHQPGCEHHGFSDLGSWRRRQSWWNCRSRRSDWSIRWNGCWLRRRCGKTWERQSEVALYNRNSARPVCVRLVSLHIAEKEGDRLSGEREFCRYG